MPLFIRPWLVLGVERDKRQHYSVKYKYSYPKFILTGWTKIGSRWSAFGTGKMIRLSSLEAGMGTDFSRTEVTIVRKIAYSQGRSDEGCRAEDQVRQVCGFELEGGKGTNRI